MRYLEDDFSWYDGSTDRGAFFKIIMPNYNNSEWLERSIGSILEQTFTDYHFVFVDDMSTDDSLEKARRLTRKLDNCLILQNTHKRWNGGTRNAGLEASGKSKYTLFLDSDDWFTSPDVLKELHDFIVERGSPDCVRLPYEIASGTAKSFPVMLNDATPEALVGSIFVACWTKCIKSDMVVKFPENTLMEDVVQHIKQSDKLNTIEPFGKPVVVYNRNNTNSCSSEQNQDLQHGKWQSSMFRYMADLLDLELAHDYSIKQRDWRASICLENIKKGVYSQSV